MPEKRIARLSPLTRIGCRWPLVEYLHPGSYTFHGVLSKPGLAELMRRAAVFVLPSELEKQACVLLEAMACGTPVVATRVGKSRISWARTRASS